MNIRLAILENDTLMREVLAAFLRNQGVDVVCATGDVDVFWAEVARRPPDVALIDHVLEIYRDASPPDGCAVVALLREVHPELSTVVLSGSNDPTLPHRCRQAGAALFLDKFTAGAPDVLAAVRSVAGSRFRH